MIDTLDLRVNALDTQRRITEVALREQLDGQWSWLTPQPRQVSTGRLRFHAKPDGQSAQVTEALFGETIEVLEERGDGWFWVRTTHDRYLGYAKTAQLSTAATQSTTSVTALRGHLFAAPRISAPILEELSFGAQLTRLDDTPVHEKGRDWWRVAYADDCAYVHAALIAPVPGGNFKNLDFIQRFLDVPYVWGGRSGWGIDCSGLTQLFHDFRIPRDADQQEAALTPVDAPEPGDLAFFPGHVGIMLSEHDMLHANATHMRVTIETLGKGPYGAQLADSLRGYGRYIPKECQ